MGVVDATRGACRTRFTLRSRRGDLYVGLCRCDNDRVLRLPDYYEVFVSQ